MASVKFLTFIVAIIPTATIINVIVIHDIEANDKDRLMRQLMRENDPDVHEIIRRYSADEMDFTEEEIEYLEPDCFITNNDGGSIKAIAAAIAQAWASGQL